MGLLYTACVRTAGGIPIIKAASLGLTGSGAESYGSPATIYTQECILIAESRR